MSAKGSTLKRVRQARKANERNKHYKTLVKTAVKKVLNEKDKICNMESKILEFHNNHNQESFKTLQHLNRKIWEKYISFQCFFNQLIIYLNKE